MASNTGGGIVIGIGLVGGGSIVVKNTGRSNGGGGNFDIAVGNVAPQETNVATSPWSNINY